MKAPSIEDAVRDTVAAERVDALRGPDSPEGRRLGAVVGEHVAHHRARRGLDLEVVAARARIDVEVLALLEAGQAVPSLRAIWALATALEVPFGTLLAGAVSAGTTFRIQPANRGRTIASASGEFRSRALCAVMGPCAPEVYELTLAPGCREDAAAHGPNTFEHIAVVRGVLTVQSGTRVAHLGPGDALFFRADQPHSYRNPTGAETVAHLVMTYAPEPERSTA